MIDKKDITGIILAGGKSSRMGTDKGFLEYEGIAFVLRSMLALEPFVSKTLLVSNNPQYDIFGTTRLDDLVKDAGPLAGIYTGLHYSETDYNLVLSCDIPLIKTEILEQLLEAEEKDDSDVIQIVSKGKPMPLIALYRKHCKNKFYELLKHGERRLYVALNQCRVKNVLLDPKMDLFTTNVNTPEELKLIEHANKN